MLFYTFKMQMGEQQKKNVPVDQKEKNSLLEDDISKDFLTSWKSMSVAGDDPMEFSFDTVTKNKKAFDFDKLDMDFSLDSADFDKLPSFNVELPELDFSSSSKKCHLDEGKTEGGSSNNRGGRKDSFSISFDFNELDAFDFGGSSEKREDLGNKCRDKEVAYPQTVGSHCIKISNAEGPISVGMDSSSKKLSPSKKLPAEMDMRVSLKVRNSSGTASPVQTSPLSHSSILEKEVATSTERPAVFNAKEEEKSHFFNKSVSEATFCLSPSEDNANLGNCAEVISSDGYTAQVSRQDKVELVRDPSFPKDKDDGTDNAKAEGDMLYSTAVTLSTLPDSPNRGPDVEKVKPVSKYNDFRDISSNFYKKPGPIMSQSRLDSLLGEKHKDVISKGLSARSLKLVAETRSGRNNGICQSGRKLVSSLGLPSKELTKSDNDMVTVQKFAGKSTEVGLTSSIVVAKSLGPTLRNCPDTVQSQIDRPSKSSPSTCLFPNMTRTVASTLTSRSDKADRDKVGSIKSPKNTRGLSSLRNLRTPEMKEDQLSPIAFKRNLPVVQSEQKTNQNNPELEAAKGASPKNTPLVNLSLKRKILEVANDDIPSFLPRKRLPESPKEIKSFKVPSGQVLIKEANSIEIHNTCASSQSEAIQVTDSFQENHDKILPRDSAVRAKLSLTCNTNSNVSRAEAYSKGLEDMCDLLRKKQEEAKELLVRALIHNNNLLLLNHPIYDEKISSHPYTVVSTPSK